MKIVKGYDKKMLALLLCFALFFRGLSQDIIFKNYEQTFTAASLKFNLKTFYDSLCNDTKSLFSAFFIQNLYTKKTMSYFLQLDSQMNLKIIELSPQKIVRVKKQPNIKRSEILNIADSLTTDTECYKVFTNKFYKGSYSTFFIFKSGKKKIEIKFSNFLPDSKIQSSNQYIFACNSLMDIINRYFVIKQTKYTD